MSVKDLLRLVKPTINDMYIGFVSLQNTKTDSEEGGKAERKLELLPMPKGRVTMAEWIDRQIAERPVILPTHYSFFHPLEPRSKGSG